MMSLESSSCAPAENNVRSFQKLAHPIAEAAARWHDTGHVAKLKTFVDSAPDVKHRELLSAALQEHMDNTHKLDLGSFLTIAYLANDGLILEEEDQEDQQDAEPSPTTYDQDSAHTEVDKWQEKLDENDAFLAQVVDSLGEIDLRGADSSLRQDAVDES
jgi:hypothetical protein